MLRLLYLLSTVAVLAGVGSYLGWETPSTQPPASIAPTSNSLNRTTISPSDQDHNHAESYRQIHRHGPQAQHQHQGPDNGNPWECGFDALHQKLFKERPDIARKAFLSELNWNKAVKHANQFNFTGGVHTVPVVVHLVHNNGPANLTDARVQTAIQHLNDAFGNRGYYNPATGVDTEIQFCLAARDPLGNPTTGITRTVSPLTVLDKNTQDLQLKNLIRWDPTRYINIWVVNEIIGSTAGYAYFPSSHGSSVDGIVIQWSFMGNTNASSSVLVHEMGHYFGLYHTFEGGCTNNDCTTQGDKVCDTPPDNTTARPPCGVANNSCTSDEDDTSVNNPFRAVALGGQGDQPDQKENYMDYSDMTCYDRFSQGQADRMQFFLHNDRASLLRSLVCAPPCTNPIQIGFTASALTTTAGTPITFTDTSTNNTLSQWFVDGTSFGTGRVVNYNFPNVGTFWVRLTANNGDPNCTQSDSIQITVFCAPPCGEICDNGIDDDGNGLIDCYDPTCDCNPCSDKQANFWYFGDRAVLNFNSGTPVSGGISRLSTSEGSTSMCDPNGNLLFYTDGITVWNRQHQIMANGTGLFGDGSLSQIAVVPKSDDPSIFYIFVPDMQAYNRGLTYSIVDMSQNGNLGRVTTKNISLSTVKTTEQITAIKHCNNKDHWVIVKGFVTNQYYVVPVTSAGVGTPLTQNIGQIHPNSGPNVGSNENTIGTMRASAQGDKLAINYRIERGIELFDFDNSTGVLSNPRYWRNGSWGLPYGLEFSPNGRFLYCSMIGAWDIYQFDITLPTAAAILGSAYQVSDDTRGGNIQIASDGKIYKAQNFQGNLDVINFPDLQGAACDFQDNTVSLGTRVSRLGLPSYIKTYVTRPLVSSLSGPTAICNTNSNSIERYVISNATCNLDTVVWRHSGPNTIQSTSDSLLLLDANTTGIDTIWATMISPCTTKTDQIVVRTIIGPDIDLGPDTSICQNGIISLNSGSGYQSCIWQDGTRDSIFTAFETGLYWVECVTYCQDTLRDSINVTVSTIPPISYPDTIINIGDTLRLTSQGGIYQHIWTPNTDLSCINCPLPIFYPDTTTTYYHIYTDSNGCVGLDTMLVQVTNNCDPRIRVDSMIEPCMGRSEGGIYTTPINGTAPYSYRWSTGDTTPILTGIPFGVYLVTITDAGGCTGQDTLVLGVRRRPEFRVDTLVEPSCATGPGTLSVTILASFSTFTYQWNTGATTNTLPNVQVSDPYQVIVTAANGCADTSATIRFADVLAVQVTQTNTGCAERRWCADVSGGIPPYQYVWQGFASSTDSCIVTSNVTGGVTLVVTDANGCAGSSGASIFNYPPPPIITIDTIQAPTSGQSNGILAVRYANPSAGTLTYQWSTGATTDTLYNLSPGTYTVTVTSTTGCTGMATAVLTELSDPAIPNAFTPNNDGTNDVFRLINVPDAQVEQFRVFNRWGQVVFDAEGRTPAWDGTYQGVPQPTEVYLYHIRYRAGGALLEQRGEVTLLR